MARKKKPGKLIRTKSEPLYPAQAKLTMKAFAGNLGGPRFGFQIEKLGKFEYCVFRAKFAARKYLDLLIQDDEAEWLTGKDRRIQQGNAQELLTSSGLWMRGNNLKDLFNYRYKSKRVRRWELPEQYEERAKRLRSDRPFVPVQIVNSTRKRNSRKGMILIGQIAKELDMHPRDARGILRDLGYEKPEKGWAWRTKEEADKIKQTLQQSRRKLQSADN
jgi:hypothetical protein